MLGKKTLVKLDLKGYTAIVKELEHLTNAKGTSIFNQNFQGRVSESLLKLGSDKGEIIRCEGDSALICFNLANDAHHFAEIVHQEMAVWSAGLESKKIILRIGCATGTLDLETYDGYLNAIAYRLEPDASAGGILIDSQTYFELSEEIKFQYDDQEIITDKNNERYETRRWLGSTSQNLSKSRNIIQLSKTNLVSSSTYLFEEIKLDSHAKIVRCIPREIQYLNEKIEDQELKMIIVLGGKYDMGSPGRKASSYEKPQHQVNIATFLISQHPITKFQWKVVAQYPAVNRELTRKVTNKKGAIDSPVVNISWHDAVEFCDRLSLKTGYQYLLPTEPQWEYACRAGTSTPFSFGETITSDYANYDGNYQYNSEPKSLFRGFTASVYNFDRPNRFGLCGMHGNVWEWCLDHWHDSYSNAPSDGSSWVSDHLKRRVIRGGSWKNEPKLCTSTYRKANDENDNCSDNVGFRIVRIIDEH